MSSYQTSNALISRFETGGSQVLPVALADIKRNAQVWHTNDDTLLQEEIIPAAVDYIEAYSAIAFITQTHSIAISGQPPGSVPLQLPVWPVQRINGIETIDAEGIYVPQTAENLAKWQTQLGDHYPALLKPPIRSCWPSQGAADALGGTRIEYVAGFGDDGTAVPSRWKQIIRQLATYWYGHRDAYDGRRVNESFARALDRALAHCGMQHRYA